MERLFDVRLYMADHTHSRNAVDDLIREPRPMKPAPSIATRMGLPSSAGSLVHCR